MESKTQEYRVAIPEEKITLTRDQRVIDLLNAMLPDVTAALNTALAELQALNVGEFTISDISQVIKTPSYLEKQVRERISENKPVKIGNLTFSAEKVKEMVEIPDLTAANRALASVQKSIAVAINNGGGGLQHVLVLNNFVISGFEATFSEEALLGFIDFNSTYAESDGEKEVALVLQEIQERVDYLAEKYKLPVLQYDRSTQNPLRQVSGFDGAQRVEIDYPRIKRHMDHFEGRNKYPQNRL
ncbi:hypothetical protein MKJ04_11490 [Pontibacter sp. E15-1]|uniref:hypothetical protein n=1 Tax=Pontibacter sp. E15-1 TaxID=2919918 RepID=UPI001F5041FD|nr:hypothetical protein [Pontibacter sp. E15-1]MCJ8165467.1 hypothetical protein [Pontibacter sp. E15-1]